MIPAVALAEARAFLRLDDEGEDAVLAGVVRAACELAAAYMGAPLPSDWNAVPEAVRLGVLRTVAAIWAARDGVAVAPDGATACWRPFRRVGL